MIDYVLIYDKQIKVPLRAKKNSPYTLHFNNHMLKMDLLNERLWAFYIYSMNLHDISERLRLYFPKGTLFESDILEFIQIYKNEHVPQTYKFSLSDIPCITQNNEEYLLLGEIYLRDPIMFSHENEMLALKILSGERSLEKIDKKNENPFLAQDCIGFDALASTFEKYCNLFMIRFTYNDNRVMKGVALAEMFLEVHGLHKNDIFCDWKVLLKLFFDWKRIFKYYFLFFIPLITIMALIYRFKYEYMLTWDEYLKVYLYVTPLCLIISSIFSFLLRLNAKNKFLRQ